MSTWMDMFEYSFNLTEKGFQFIAWPNGRSFMEQEVVTIECFDVLKEEVISVKQQS